VLCEKPLAATVEDAAAMVASCEKHQVKLMTAYRLHFEEGNLQAIQVVQSGRLGTPRVFTSIHTSQVEAGNTRLDGSLGGGPLEDIGIYSINAARYLFQAEPVEASAFAVHGNDPRFEEVPETVTAMLRFPNDRLATFICGFGEAGHSEYRVIGADGTLTMNPAFTWQGDIQQKIVVKGREEARTFEHRDQVAAELLYFAECIQMDQTPEPSGHEGLIDVKIIHALRTSAATGRAEKLSLDGDTRPNLAQSIQRDPPRQPEPINAAAPAKK
jgi:predicted dehydrogenase